MYPHLLLSRVLKAHYFASASFFVAEVGDRPSWTWRSSLLTRPYLEAGLRRRIGNGEQTSIWGDAWLSSEGSGRIITTRPVETSFPHKVSDLIDEATGEWSMESLSANLWPCDIENTLNVPIGASGVEDTTYWYYSRNGRFNVRSCYYQVLLQQESHEATSSGHSHALSSKDWKWIWGLQLPPKIRTFLWRHVMILSL